jgi:tRNA G18 (ribose-2'-O)-methylase SpoU
LPLAQQHRKCAQILRTLYESRFRKENGDPLLGHYRDMAAWMGLSLPPLLSLETISDLYHEHLRQSGYAVKEHNFLPKLKSQDRLQGEDFLPISIYLDHVRSAYNVGSILRTTEAMRLGSLSFSEKTPSIDNEKVRKTSMESYSLISATSDASLDPLPRPWIGLDTSENAVSLYDFIFPKEFTLILGNEEYGIHPSILQQLDYLLEIPLQGCKNSINVACAYAIAAFEIRRQKAYFTKTIS